MACEPAVPTNAHTLSCSIILRTFVTICSISKRSSSQTSSKVQPSMPPVGVDLFDSDDDAGNQALTSDRGPAGKRLG